MNLTSMILMGAGFAVLVGNLMFKSTIEKIPFLAGKSYIVLILAVVLIVAGVFLGQGQKKMKEVPIYDKAGKNIVGYRRMK